jgi:carbonic anhydrase/acetyltransferase-like protein (isoleucine patch superfamily)
VPGRVVRELTDEDRMGFAHTAAHYVDRAARHRAVSWRQTPDN